MEWRWKNKDKYIELGEKFVIAPPWAETEREKITFVKGVSFGTGAHETNVSCIKFLEKVPLENATVLDIGIGSGILSIAALKLGADKAVGFDIDEKAVEECVENGKLNNVKNLECFCADSMEKVEGSFDVILANIFADIIVFMKNDINKHIKNKGYLLLSGVVWEENYTVRAAFEKLGFKTLKNEFLKDYSTILLQKIG